MQVIGCLSKGIDNWGHVSVIVFSVDVVFLFNNWHLNTN